MIDSIHPNLHHLMTLRECYVSECEEDELHEIDSKLSNMRTQWNAVNKEFRIKYTAFNESNALWEEFHDDLKLLSATLDGLKNVGIEEKVHCLISDLCRYKWVVFIETPLR